MQPIQNCDDLSINYSAGFKQIIEIGILVWSSFTYIRVNWSWRTTSQPAGQYKCFLVFEPVSNWSLLNLCTWLLDAELPIWHKLPWSAVDAETASVLRLPAESLMCYGLTVIVVRINFSLCYTDIHNKHHVLMCPVCSWELIILCVCQEEDSLDDSSDTSTQEKPTRKIYYKLRLFPGKWINILYDRLTLLSLLDR